MLLPLVSCILPIRPLLLVASNQSSLLLLAYHAVDSARTRLEKAGFQLIRERESWTSTLKPGGKYYLTRNASALVAFTIGHKWRPGNSVAIIGAHTDSPCLRIKPVSKRSAYGYNQVGVEAYGGGIWTSWFDRDLSVAGRVLVQENGNIVQKLVKIEKPILRIPTLAIHLHRQSNFDPNKETELFPILDLANAELNKSAEESSDEGEFKPLGSISSRHHPALLNVIAEDIGTDVASIVDFELLLYDTQKSAVGGLNDEYIFSPRLDNLEMTYCSIMGLIHSTADASALDNDSTIRMTVCFDHEEVGSETAHGARSNLIPAILRRVSVIPGSPGSDASYDHVTDDSTAYEQTLSRSFLVSADMAHAVHPNYAGKHEEVHRPSMNKGVVIKINANNKYATNSPGIVLIEECARAAKVPLQMFVVRNDSLCGSTIGPALAAKLGMRTIDIGNPQLSMHSIRETGGSADVESAIKLFDSFYKLFGVLEPKILID